MTEPDKLKELCRLCGVDIEYTDIWGKPHAVPERTLLALLAAMGVDAADETSLRSALKARRWRPWQRMLAPVQVVRAATSPTRIPLVFAVSDAALPFEWKLWTEAGRESGGKTSAMDLELLEQRDIDGDVMARYAMILPESLPCGYHRFEIKCASGNTASLSLIVAPDACYLPPALAGEGRVWGPAAQLYTLRSRHNWGIGDFTDLRGLLEQCRESGADIIGLNPLHDLFPHNPQHASPYSPSSRQFLNYLYIDVEAIPEFTECESVRQMVAAPEFQTRLQALRAAECVDHGGVAAMKRPVLEELYSYFRRQHVQTGTDSSHAFRAFIEAGGEGLYRHALYEALQEYFHAQDPAVWGWEIWPQAFRDPRSSEVRQFAESHHERVEFFQYLQWHAETQLAAAGHRSLELRLGVGLYQDLAISVDRASAEVWANQSLFVTHATIGAPPDDFNLNGQNWGLPPWNPDALVESAYAPFIATLRANMRHSGGLRIDHVMGLMRLFWVPRDAGTVDGTYVHYPFDDLLGIVALESQRNRCLVIGEDLGTVPDAVRSTLASSGVFTHRLLYFEKDPQGDFKPPGDYPQQALVAVSTHDLPTLSGFWHGDDLSERAALNHFPSEAERDRQVIARAEDRARLLLALDREKLLPEGMTVYPISSPDMTLELMCAVHDYLANTPSKIMLVQLEDVLGQRRQVNFPGTSEERPNWRYKLVLDMEDLAADPRWKKLTNDLRARRLPAPVPVRRQRVLQIPTATYRLQFHRDFTFAQAAALVPYLQRLGISHCYASPYLKARAGSRHGYDIVDHNALNPEIGSAEDYDHFVRTLHDHGLGQIVDIVPNHMGVGGDDNQWWMDVLENGQASAYAGFFDIDWHPPKDDLRGKVLSPVLGDHYGRLLESGEIKLAFEAGQGTFAVRYYSNRFPIDPQSYPLLLGHDLARLERQLGADHPLLSEFQSLITALRNLPGRGETDEARIKERRRDKEVHKRRLAQMAREHPEILRFIEENVAIFNGVRADARSFDLLHNLLDAQAFRLANWRVASDEINYRRFFDINDLAGLRTENPEVFEATHRLIFELIAQEKIDGLRIDHPDGLFDPVQYYDRLNHRIRELVSGVGVAQNSGEPASTAKNPSIYLVVEKILASHERLPENWQVHGTTGYDFTNLVNGLFVYGPAEREMDRIYRHFAGLQPDFDDLLYECKKLVMRTTLSSELHVLTNYLDRISESDRYTRDFTLTAQHTALFEVVACFPVYRTYVTSEEVTDDDRRNVDSAIAAAKRRSTAADTSIFDFIRRILLLQDLEGRSEGYRRAVVEFVMRFQQYTAPVMAKGLEDTMFYRYNRLLSLNEVGGNGFRFAVSIPAFHIANQERLRRWPHAMLCTSSHDTKRSEDARVRINVLSEIAGEWRIHLSRWSRINRSKKHRLETGWAPSQNDEYLLYQTLLGAWPAAMLDTSQLADLRQRIEAYMLKAIREAKVHTSWINPHHSYEEGVAAFVQALLDIPERNLFLEDFLAFHHRVAHLGRLNSLSQTLISLTSPGVPDIYQGTELWDLSLVDPDNRRPVDYPRRQNMLEELSALATREGKAACAERVRALLDTLEDGKAKLYLTWQALSLRRDKPHWFGQGSYLPLGVDGPRADHLCAFARVYQDQAVVTAAPRWFSKLVSDTQPMPLGKEVWADTWVEAPAEREYLNVLTGEKLGTTCRNGKIYFAVQNLFAYFPVALLITT
ncbi:MAG: malto-oligosyltrehalose synthase [Sulfuricaulis sp.]|uniref:malto-oligosyltrehalose synthase n=1 Tax=Sulfuricaulis sp. TaxID=2003553 RepID=UPI003C61B677